MTSRARLPIVVSAPLVAFALLAAPTAHAGQQCTSGTTLLEGVDVFDGTGSVDWATAKANGIVFGIAKASQGTYDTDSEFANNWSAMKAAGVVRGAYHFLDPTESGIDQANFFLGIVGTLDATDLPPILDIECPSGNNEPDSDDCLGTGSSGDATGAAITQVMNDWLTTIKSATGRTAIVYSYGSYFSDDDITTTTLPSYPLWIAYPTTSDCFDFPDPWTSAVMWQYSDTGTVSGIGSGVDLDYFLGDMSALSMFIANGTSPITDAGAPADAGDAGVPCTVPGSNASGICMLTSDCAMLPGGVSTPDLCPGPADIECCTWDMASADGGSGTDATVGGVDSGTGTSGGKDAGSGTGPGNGSDAGTSLGGTLDGGPSNASHDATTADGAPVEDADAPGSGGCSTSPRSSDGPFTMAFLAGALVLARRKRRRAA